MTVTESMSIFMDSGGERGVEREGNRRENVDIDTGTTTLENNWRANAVADDSKHRVCLLLWIVEARERWNEKGIDEQT